MSDTMASQYEIMENGSALLLLGDAMSMTCFTIRAVPMKRELLRIDCYKNACTNT